MDKYEYKIRAEEIKGLIGKKKFAEAMKIADSIDWRRVSNVNMLCKISDLYKINRKFEESREILLLAYEHHPGGRMIVYSLCELSIKLGDIVQAVEYFKEFVRIAPNDNGIYILKYKLYEANEVPLEERIAVLEELKQKEYREKWAYELAYLYHRIGLSTKCVEECDDLILWFGEGKYVKKAMELKMLHAPLTDEQQKKYAKENKYSNIPNNKLDIEVKPINVGEYGTINLQKELAESMKEVFGDEKVSEETRVFEEAKSENNIKSKEDIREIEEEEILSAEEPGELTKEIISNLVQADESEEEESEEFNILEEEPDVEEVFFEESDTMELPEEEETFPKIIKMTNTGEIPKIVQKEQPKFIVPSAETMANQKNEKYDGLLSQEYDGQIGLAVEKKEPAEKQITGQMSIEDILQEWEKLKRDNDEKRAKRIKQQTGEMFSEFDAAAKKDILAELESMADESESKEEVKEETETTAKTSEKVSSEEIKEKKDEGEQEEEKTEIKSESKSEIKQEKISENPVKKQRPMTNEEKKLFGPFIQTRGTRDQLMDVLDNISLAAYTGNVIITGDPGMESVKLAKNIIKEVQQTDSNFSGRMAKITGHALNGKNIEKTMGKLSNGALIIENAGNLKENTVKSMVKLLEQDNEGIIVILEDTKINMNKLLDTHQELLQNFNLRVDVEALDNDSLVQFAKKYATDQEYSIDDLGVLALYTRISELQTSEHSVTTGEIKEIIDDAINHANKKNISHFMDILFAKRYDEDDMIVLRERDFI